MIDRCLSSLFEKTSKNTLSKIEVLIGYNGNDENEFNRLNSINTIVKCIKQDHYHFSENCNELAKLAKNDVLLFLNDDIEFTSDAITYTLNMLEQDVYDKIGAIGLKLLYPDKTMQHYGHKLILDKNDNFVGISHWLKKNPDFHSSDIYAIGVTGAFMMMKTSIFMQFGMFNESYQKCFEDVELCLKLTANDKLNICIGRLSAIHHESITRKNEFTQNNDLSKIDENKNYVLKSDSFLLKTFFDNQRHNILKNKILYGNTIFNLP